MNKPQLVTYSVADISTAHITPRDNELLSGPTPSSGFFMLVVATEYGWLVHVEGLHTDEERQADWRNAGMSNKFVDTCVLASTQGCKWADFDCDGIVYDSLPQVDW